MRTFYIIFVVAACLLTGCSVDSWEKWAASPPSQKIELQNQTFANAKLIAFKDVEFKNIKLIDVIKYINQHQNEYNNHAVTVIALTKPIKDFSANPGGEIREMESLPVTIKSNNITLDSLIHDINPAGALVYFYGNNEAFILPLKYSTVMQLYEKRVDMSQVADFPSLEPMISLLNGYFENFGLRNLKLELRTGSNTEDAKMLGQIFRGPFEKADSLYDLICKVKAQFNLNCILDDEGNLELVPK